MIVYFPVCCASVRFGTRSHTSFIFALFFVGLFLRALRHSNLFEDVLLLGFVLDIIDQVHEIGILGLLETVQVGPFLVVADWRNR